MRSNIISKVQCMKAVDADQENVLDFVPITKVVVGASGQGNSHTN